MCSNREVNYRGNLSNQDVLTPRRLVTGTVRDHANRRSRGKNRAISDRPRQQASRNKERQDAKVRIKDWVDDCRCRPAEPMPGLRGVLRGGTAMRYYYYRHALLQKCCKPCCQPCCQQCTVMKTCQEVVYEYKEMTAYKVVYEDVEDKVKVPCVEYEPAPRPACVPDTVLVPPMPGDCPPAACPPANACGPLITPSLVPMSICRKVMLEGYRPVEKEKPDVTKRSRRQTGPLPGDALHPARRYQAGTGHDLLPCAVWL